MKKIFMIVIISNLLVYGHTQIVVMPEFSSLFVTDINKYQIIDTATYEISYSLKYKSNVNNKIETIIDDVCILQIGKRLSKTYSREYYLQDSSLHASKTSRATGYKSAKPAPPVEIFKRFPTTNQCTEIRATWGGYDSPILKYSETMPQFDWTIVDQKKNILGYSCTKATLKWRGRDYEAWFTSDIPLNDGPWKFGGLPGLIMAIKDTQNHYVFECIGIRQIKDKIIPVKFYERRYEECSRTKFYETLKKMYERPQQWMKAQGGKVRLAGTSEMDNLIVIYNPLELE